MEQKNDTGRTVEETRSNDGDLTAKDMQTANATGANQNEQGQASFSTGSTTGGGSNFGQGSSHLGGESYRQGDKVSAGANYGNETGRLGSSATGTSNEGASSATAGAAASGSSDASIDQAGSDTGPTGPAPERRAPDPEVDDLPTEGERRDTSLERDSGLSDGQLKSSDSGRSQSGSWSRSSTAPD